MLAYINAITPSPSTEYVKPSPPASLPIITSQANATLPTNSANTGVTTTCGCYYRLFYSGSLVIPLIFLVSTTNTVPYMIHQSYHPTGSDKIPTTYFGYEGTIAYIIVWTRIYVRMYMSAPTLHTPYNVTKRHMMYPSCAHNSKSTLLQRILLVHGSRLLGHLAVAFVNPLGFLSD
jgi:hypothetical protein